MCEARTGRSWWEQPLTRPFLVDTDEDGAAEATLGTAAVVLIAAVVILLFWKLA